MNNLIWKKNLYSFIISSAIIEGVFLGIFIRTEMDVSPIGIAKLVIETLEPLIPESWESQIEIIKFIVDVAGFILLIPIILVIFVVGWKKGLVVFLGVFVSLVLFVGYS